MKRWICVLLVLALALSLAGCGRGGSNGEAEPSPTPAEPVREVKIDLNNLFQYFEYKEFPSIVREDNGTISSVQVSYGLALRPGYEAANLPEYTDTMSLTFTAVGVVKTGEFTVDYDTLAYSGTESSVTREDVTESLDFWPEGNRTFVWTFGNYSKSNIMYLENFQVLNASGSIFLKNQ